MTWTRIAIAFSLAVAVGCARQSSSAEPPGVARSAGLTAAASCDALKSRIADTASRQMRLTIDSYRANGWAWGGGILRADSGGPPAGGAPVPTSSGPAATTGTNDQVAGVDEGDFVKSDGTRLLVLSGRRLFLSKSWPPQSLALASSLEIEGWPTELHLDERGRAVVLSMVPDVWTPRDAPRPLGPIGICAADAGCFFGPGTTKVTIIDAADVASPRILDEQFLPGRVRASRRIGASVRVVLSDDVRWPAGVRFWPDWNGDAQDQDKWNKLLDALEADNDRLIRSAPLESWLPPGQRRLRDGSVADVGYSCNDFYLTSAPVRLGLVTVATLDLDGGGAAGRTSIIGEASQVYSSAQTLYVAEDHWWWWPKPGQRDVTYLHAFDLSDPGRARYTASGSVEGHPIDQFALDEFNGDLRVAALIARRVEDAPDRWGRLDLSNQVSVLRREGGELAVIGQTAELSPGESLRSARFAGDRGYLVTFRNIDPLISLDLSDPRAPRAAGELKVPGFATYLHPIDADNLIALGVDVPEPDANGRVDFSQRKMKLSLFDVAQLAAPKLRFTQLIGTAYGWSEAAYEHRAFNWFAARKLLAIPFSDWVAADLGDPWRNFVSDLKIYRVDVGSGFTALGAMDLKDLFARSGTPRFDGWYSAWVRRSVMSSDGAGTEYVYAVSDAGLRVATTAALSKPLASVAFPREPPALLP